MDVHAGVVLSSGVDENFGMLVPIYLELADGRMFLLGRAHMTGNKAVEQKIPLHGLKDPPKRALVNGQDEVLASPN